MTSQLLILVALLATAACVTIKVANTMGPGTSIEVKCASGDDVIEPHTLSDGQDFQWTFSPNLVCSTEFWCDANGSGKSAHFTVYKGNFISCPQGDSGFFLRGDGIYQGNLDGSGINKVQGW